MTIKDLKKGTLFKVVNKNGKVGNKVYVRSYYACDHKYYAYEYEDVNCDKCFKETQEVTTEFEY